MQKSLEMWEQVHSAPWVVTLLITPLKKSDDFVRTLESGINVGVRLFIFENV